MFSRFVLVVVCWLTLAGMCAAQTVRSEDSGWGLMLREAENAAEQEGRTDWPVFRDGGRGTQVHLSFDIRNADATLATNASYTLPALLADGKTIAAALQKPKTDFITGQGKHGVYCDLEFNDYLVRKSRTETAFSLDLSALRDALNATRLPRPIIFYIELENDGAEKAVLNVPGTSPRRLTKSVFLGLNEIPDGLTLQREATLPWYSVFGLLFFGWVVAWTTYLPWQLFANTRKARREQAKNPVLEAPDPAKVQEEYNKSKFPFYLFLIPAGMMILMATGTMGKALKASLLCLQVFNIPMWFIIVGAAGPMALSQFVAWIVDKQLQKRESLPAPPVDPDDPPHWTKVGSIYPMMLAPLGMLLVGPTGLLRVPRPVMIPLLITLFVLAFGGMIVVSLLARRATHTRLHPGDPWHDMVQEEAALAGRKVRRVEVSKTPFVNAYVSIFGTVGLTSALLRRMEPDEVRIVVAHEVGHHKDEHAGRAILLSLLVTAALLGIWFVARDYVIKNYAVSIEAKVLMNSPIFAIFVLPFLRMFLTGGAQRKHEELADRYAVDRTGDPEKVIAMLRKLHTLNGSPHYLKPHDEMMSSHPSLANRIEAIRRYAAEKNLTPTE